MSFRRHRRVAAVLLIPALPTFALQWALEVSDPIEERYSAHDHQSADSPVVYDSSACDLGDHEHFCPHSNAFAPIRQLTAIFRAAVLPPPDHQWQAPRVLRSRFPFLERGPPIV